MHRNGGHQPAAAVEPLDWDLFSHAVEASMTVRSREQFYVWLQGPVYGVLPHQILVCGVRGPGGTSMLTQHFTSSRYFRQEHFEAVVHPSLGLIPQVAPMLRELDDTILLCTGTEVRASPALNGFMSTSELKNVAVKLLNGVGGQMEAFYCFARISAQFDTRLRSAVELLTPHIHATLVRMLAAELQSGVGSGAAPAALGPATPLITARQAEILGLVKNGLTNAEIAHILSCSQWTVKNHIQNILRRLGTKSRSHALAQAMRLGLLAPD